MTPADAALFNAAQFNQMLFGGGTSSSSCSTVQAGQGLLYPALRKAAVTLGPGRTPSPAQFQDAIDELNRLTASLNCDRLNIYSNQRLELPLTAGRKTYTIGPACDPASPVDFDAPRPQGIERANIIYNSGGSAIRYPLAQLTVLQWPLIAVQDLPASIPQAIYNDRGYPVSTLYLYGQPMAGCALELFCWVLIPAFRNVTDVVLLPPGYEDALVLNLAVRLAPHFQRVLDPNVREDARLSLMRLESINAPRPIADVSGGLGCGSSQYNVYSDTWAK
jgi:hypothetical protein